MLIKHFSRDNRYRRPFGACPCDSEVELYLEVDSTVLKSVELQYVYGLSSYQHGFATMQITEPGDNWYSVKLHLPMERGLLFYWFKLIETSGRISYFIKDETAHDSGGWLVDSCPLCEDNCLPVPLTWQITVYEADFYVPDWFQGGVIYQIFPDRFHRGSDFNYNKMCSIGNSEERIYHRNWDDEVDIIGKPHTGYMACDFYGGTLRGIIEKLDYIKSLSTDVIYLNPVFQARSNHRYDTGDYFAIDPMLGTIEDFQALCIAAAERDIRIVLDGVFSHTGADSKYFNLYGRYDSVGAWQAATEGKTSPYSSWFDFDCTKEPPAYDSWWGFKDLPNVSENDLHYTNFILGEEGVVKFWLDHGVSGFRLDVSDELPDQFLRNFRRKIKSYKADSVLLGEVWEDPTTKISYGHLRDFLLGASHDSVMGYPFRKAVLEWLTNQSSTTACADALLSIQENYPRDCIYSNMNLLSTHDTVRAVTVLAELPDPGERSQQLLTELSASQRHLGERRLLLATLLQVALPGMVSIYYGDEYAAEGFRDPFNRRTFREDSAQGEFFEEFCKIISLRSKFRSLRRGACELLTAQGDVLVWRRYSNDNENDNTSRDSGEVVIAINRASYPQAFYFEQRDYVLAPLGAKVIVNGKLVHEID